MLRSPPVIVTLPPSASMRSCGERRSDPRSPSALDLECELALLAPDAHLDRGAGRRVFERIQHAEIDGAGDLRRSGHLHVDIDPRLHTGAARRRPELRRQPACFEQRREDPAGELPRLRQRPPHLALQLVEERLRRRGFGVDRSRRDLEVDREPHQILLHAARAGTARCRDVQRRRPARVVSARFGAPRSHGATHRGSPARRSARSPVDVLLCLIPRQLSAIARAASSGQHGTGTDGSIPAFARPPP